MKNVLVTGANGQLGRCIHDQADEHSGLSFVFTDYKELDITSQEKVNKFLEDKKFDYCINCAAYTAVDKAEEEVEQAYLINAEGVKNLAESCKKYNVVLVHVSTDFVFDGQKDTPYTEEDIPNPINVYGKSKLKGEQYVEQILNKYFIIRTSWVYSEYGHNFVKTMLRLGKERDEISVVNDQIGSPTYAGDLAKVIINIISNNKNSYGLYHYSNEGIASWYDFAKAIFDVTKKEINVKAIGTKDYITPATRPSYSVLNKDKIKKSFRVQVPVWDDSLEECVNFIVLYECK